MKRSCGFMLKNHSFSIKENKFVKRTLIIAALFALTSLTVGR